MVIIDALRIDSERHQGLALDRQVLAIGAASGATDSERGHSSTMSHGAPPEREAPARSCETAPPRPRERTSPASPEQPDLCYTCPVGDEQNQGHAIPDDLIGWCRALSQAFSAFGHELYSSGAILGPDRVEGRTRRGYGDDRVVAFAALLEIAGDLAGGAASLLDEGRLYAAAAMVRQVVEVEYLLWAFSEHDEVARDWLQSDQTTLRNFFRPATIRKRSNGEFRDSEYHFHCNFGGHPSPDSTRLLVGHGHCLPTGVILADLAGHLQRLWDRSTVVWQQLHNSGALVPDPPSLLDALSRKPTACRRHDHPGAVLGSDQASTAIDRATGRVDITFPAPSAFLV